MTGYKTYIMAGIALVLSAAALAGFDVSAFNVTPDNAVQTAWGALSLAFLRHGVTQSGN